MKPRSISELKRYATNPMEIKFKLIEKSNIEVILPLLHELDSSISEIVLKARLSEMVEKEYECVGIYSEN